MRPMARKNRESAALLLVVISSMLTVLGMGQDDRSGLVLIGLGIAGFVVAIVLSLAGRGSATDD